MSETICGHDRGVLIWAFDYSAIVWRDNQEALVEALGGWRDRYPARFDALVEITDPAKLAAIIAELIRQHGITVDVCKAIEFRGVDLIVVGNEPREEDALELPAARALARNLLWSKSADEALALLKVDR